MCSIILLVSRLAHGVTLWLKLAVKSFLQGAVLWTWFLTVGTVEWCSSLNSASHSSVINLFFLPFVQFLFNYHYNCHSQFFWDKYYYYYYIILFFLTLSFIIVLSIVITLLAVMNVLINLLFIHLCPILKLVYNTQPSFNMVNGSFNPICASSWPVYCQSDEIGHVLRLRSDGN